MGLFIGNPIRKLGAWLARARNTNYEASTDGTVHAFKTAVGNLIGFTDAGNPPTIERQRAGQDPDNWESSLTMKVRQGHFWKVTATGAATVFWIPEK